MITSYSIFQKSGSKDNRGFTIVEALSMSVILLFVLLAIFSTYIVLTQYATDTTAQAELQRQARTAVDRMARDIREAESVSPSAGASSTVTLTYPTWMILPNSRYRLVGTQVLYASNVGSGQESVIANNVILAAGSTLFDTNGGLVTIDLRLERASISGTTLQSRLTTTVQVRNAP